MSNPEHIPPRFIVRRKEDGEAAVCESGAGQSLVPPYGDAVVNLIADRNEAAAWKTQSRYWPSWELTARQVSTVDDVLKRIYRERPGDLAGSLGWHFPGHSAAFVHIWIFLFLLEHPATLAAVAAAGFLSFWCDLLTFAIPLYLGALEGSRILALRAVGGNAALGLALGMAIRIAQLSWACYGLAAYLLLTLRKPGWRPALSATTEITPTDAPRLIYTAERKTDG